MTEKKIWSMDELIALTDEVQIEKVEYRGKMVEFQFCELTEKEEPKFTGVTDSMSEEKKIELYTEIGTKRVIKMLAKANKKNPEGPSISEETWAAFPSTLRFAIAGKIVNVEQEGAENFRN